MEEIVHTVKNATHYLKEDEMKSTISPKMNRDGLVMEEPETGLLSFPSFILSEIGPALKLICNIDIV